MAHAQDSDVLYQPPMPPTPALHEGTGQDPERPAPYHAPAQPMPWQQGQPTQVTEATFLAARLREALAEAANLRQAVADLQVENSKLRAVTVQVEIDKLEKTYQVGRGTTLVGKADGTYWRMPQQQPTVTP